VIRHQGRILICQRRAEGGRPGLWEFPGGKREPGESLKECLVREVREEVGCEVVVGKLLDRVEFMKEGRPLQLSFYESALRSGQPVTIEHAHVIWAAPAELGAYQFLSPNVDIIARLRRAEAP